DLHRIAIERTDAVTGAVQAWHVVAPNIGRDVVLPAVPSGLTDPLDSAGAPATVHVTHAGLWLPRGFAWQELFAHGDPVWPDLLQLVEGYSVRGEDVAIE
ncbi:MAG: hypothetical protein V3T05_05205, partial [Myxococcota bacterium]